VSTYTSVSKDLHVLQQSRIAEQQVHEEAGYGLQEEKL
jgi:hypothetical protein